MKTFLFFLIAFYSIAGGFVGAYELDRCERVNENKALLWQKDCNIDSSFSGLGWPIYLLVKFGSAIYDELSEENLL